MLVGLRLLMKASLPQFFVFTFSHVDVKKEYMSSQFINFFYT